MTHNAETVIAEIENEAILENSAGSNMVFEKHYNDNYLHVNETNHTVPATRIVDL